MTLTLDINAEERAAADEMRTLLGLRTDEDLLCAALYKLAAWLEPDVDPSLFALRVTPRVQARLRPPIEEPDLPLFGEPA